MPGGEDDELVVGTQISNVGGLIAGLAWQAVLARVEAACPDYKG